MNSLRKTAAAAAISLIVLAAACSGGAQRPVFNKPADADAIKALLQNAAPLTQQDGIAAAILLDTTGSMSDEIRGADLTKKPKLRIAQQALRNLLQQFAAFAKKHPDKKILVGVYEFSTRSDQPACRQIFQLAPPDPAAAEAAIQALKAEGSTPIGDAMIAAKRDLDATGMSRRHILVITDGENNRGYMPGDVTRVISQEPEAARAVVYFIALDVGAEVFDPVKVSGGLVLSAQGEQQLADTLDYILTGKILVEQPAAPSTPPHPSVIIRK